MIWFLTIAALVNSPMPIPPQPMVIITSRISSAGLRGQQSRGGAVSAAMIPPCADDVLHAAVLDRQPLPWGSGDGGVVGSCLLFRAGNRFTLPPLTRPTNERSRVIEIFVSVRDKRRVIFSN
jgi:hypothetical protein